MLRICARVWAPHEARVQHARQGDVVDVGAVAGEQARVLDPVDAGAGVPGGAARREARHASLADQPPSTGMIAPLTNDARSDTRNAATSATSIGSPARPSAAFSSISGNFSRPDAPMISLRMKPGQMAFTRMPRSPYSTAPALVTAMTPAFVAE